MEMKIILIGILLLSAGCNKGESVYFSDPPNTGYYVEENQGEVDYSGETEDWPKTFNGYTCTGDCSGHEAGYEWAERKGINNADDCSGNSNSFIEGCISYVEGNYE
jgi:hypothetical protein